MGLAIQACASSHPAEWCTERTPPEIRASHEDKQDIILESSSRRLFERRVREQSLISCVELNNVGYQSSLRASSRAWLHFSAVLVQETP
ncbi:hypothetical protein J6590_078866 [Homalodisca vitripennis]|nr:hypothetical protein J6590_078866 [Homalodisca vitripennis]